MTGTRTWTVTECLDAIDALETERDALRAVPVRGMVGKTQVDLTGKRSEIDADLALWRTRLDAARNGGHARRGRWGC